MATKASSKKLKKLASEAPLPPPVIDLDSAPRLANDRYRLYVAAFVMAVMIFAGTAMYTYDRPPAQWEASLFAAINSWSESLYRPFALITLLGGAWTAVISVVGLFFARMYRLAWRLALTICGAYGIAYLTKHFIGRARPVEWLTDAHARVAETGMGFPSGHATLVTVIALTLFPYLPKVWRWIAAGIVAAVCLSRLYLGVHLPLDLVGGVALGTAVVAFVRILPQRLRHLLRIS